MRLWAAADSRARGFLIGATAGRTTLAGEGLQHQDGSSHVMAALNPNCIAYDPAYAYELAVIVRDGMRRMLEAQEDVFYYVTVMNENYAHPAMPAGAEEGILKGMHRVRAAGKGKKHVRLLGAGAILREVLAAAEALEAEHGVAAEVRLYDRLFTAEDPDAAEGGFVSVLNPESLTVVEAWVEPSLAEAEPEWVCQFERTGYFVADRREHVKGGKPVFNRTVALRDSWAKKWAKLRVTSNMSRVSSKIMKAPAVGTS